MKVRTILYATMALLLAVFSTTARAQVRYGNPVIGLNCPDPSVLDDRANSGYFYAYTTQSVLEPAMNKVVNLPIYRSTDLVNWEFVGDGFPNGHPDWVKGANLWAPDINIINGKYVLYYALGKWGGIFSSACGVATADSPEGPFEDYDRLTDFRTVGTLNAIDPDYFCDSNGSFLIWGSMGGGIYGIELTDDGLFIKPGARKKLLASFNAEAPLLYERDGWYYLFASAGSCCRGERSKYHIIVGRAKHPMGPYTGPDGQSMLKLSYKNTILSSSRDRVFVGPGHNSGIITDDAGNDWILYHSYYAGDGYATRQLNLDQIKWNYNGWPYFETGEPSGSNLPPVFGPHKPQPKVKPEIKPEKENTSAQLPGGYSQPRAPYKEEIEMFNKLTNNSGVILTPEQVSTQVVAGMNYKFICKCEDATHRSVGKCQIVVYKPLAGDPEITEMSLLK